MATFSERLIGAAKLDVHTYEEVEADSSALGQAVMVVVLSSIAAGIGMLGRGGIGLIAGVVVALIGWLIWAWLTYFIGARILPEPQTHADWGQLLRTTGFAQAPGIIRVLGIVPLLSGLVFFAAAVWVLIAFVIAIRQALDYTSTLRAVAVALIGWLVQGILLLLTGLFIR